jgi:hypothetical protein
LRVSHLKLLKFAIEVQQRDGVILGCLRRHRSEPSATRAVHLGKAVHVPSFGDDVGGSHSQNVGPAAKGERDVLQSKTFERCGGPPVAIQVRA